MAHPLVAQLRFARSEFQRTLEGLTDDEARQRFLPMNCISWNLGHVATAEQQCWLEYSQGRSLLPHLDDLFAYGAPASTPALVEMLDAWHTITRAADPWLDTLTSERLQQPFVIDGEPVDSTFGSFLLRLIYHYWYHTGENMAIRQLLGHTDLPEFVGNIESQAPYRPE